MPTPTHALAAIRDAVDVCVVDELDTSAGHGASELCDRGRAVLDGAALLLNTPDSEVIDAGFAASVFLLQPNPTRPA
jgi:hypothetical protein